MAEGYNIAPLPAPKLVMMPQIGAPRLLAPGEFAPPIVVPKWDTSALAKAGEGIGELISEIFPSEQKKLEREAKKVALETSKITAAANAAEAERALSEIENPDLEIERKMRLKRAESDIGYEDNMRTAIIGRYGIKGIKALNAAELSGKDVRSPQGQESVLDELDNQLPTRSTGQSSASDVNAILDQTIDTPEQGALAVRQLKELGYDATLSQGAADKLGMKSWKLGIKGYNPTSSAPTLASSLPKDESGVPDLEDPMFSIPLSTVDQYSHIQNPKAKDQARVASAKLADKYILDNAKNVEAARDTIEKANTFLELNKQNSSPIYNRIIPKWAPDLDSITGTSLTGSSDIENMRSITNELTPRMRQGMPGAASDKDIQMFRGATLDPTRPLAANERIGKALISRSQDAIDEQQFKAQYAAYNGDLKGADSAWQQYLNSNPIFDPNSPQSDFKINENRLSWQDFFKLKNIDTLAKKKLISPEAAQQQKAKILGGKSVANSTSVSQDVITATGPNGEKVQLINGQWTPMS